MKCGLFIVGLSLLAFATVRESSAADVEHGEELARRWCASCHVVSPDQRGSSTEAPAFAQIAQSPGFDSNRLAFFLLEPHPKMPSMSLTRIEATDLAAYIATLAK
jgi:mono/diheme cytochrome c family protein